MWSQSRFAVFSKSPATGGYGESYCGGSVAPKIKACGVDAIVIHGQCDRLTSLLIDENGVTFKNADEIAQCAARVPIDRILIETDSPYLAPEPHRKVRPNQPCTLPAIARFIARRRGMADDAFIRYVDANAERCFRLPKSGDSN